VFVPGLRIRAPATAQRASLEENDGPDAGAVVDTEPLDVEYQPELRRSLLLRRRSYVEPPYVQ
jgi:hypothetical protein